MDPKSTVLDGGWGWAVVLAGMIGNFLCMGFLRSGGIIYISSVETFHASRTKAAWIPMVTATTLFLSAPLGTAIAKRYNYHTVVAIGATIAVLGLVCCYFASVIDLMFVGWGGVFGLGSSFVLFPCIASIGHYFRKRRPLGTGLVLAGGSVGSMCLPPLLEYVIKQYSFKGALLIACAVVMHYWISAFLLKLVSSYIRTRNNRILIKRREMTLINNKDVCNDELTVSFIPDENGETPVNLQTTINNSSLPVNNVNNYSPISLAFFRTFLKSIDLSVINNRTFLVNCTANAFQTGIFLGTVTLLPDYAEDEIGVTRIEGAYAVSAAALSDLSIRLLVGWLLSKKKLPKETGMTIVLVINVVILFGLGYFRVYAVMIFCAFVSGACFASGMVLYFEILASCQPPEKYLMAVGFSEMAKALFTVVIASTLGSLKDASGNYTLTFLVFTALMLVAVILWVIEICLKKRQKMEK